MPSTSPGLERCVGDVDAFLEKAWTRVPHRHERHGDDVYADLLSYRHVDEIVSTMSLRTPAFRLVKGGRPLPPTSYTRPGTMGSRHLTDLADPGRIYEQFRGGATIVLQGMQRWWPPLARFCRALELTLTQPIQANAYITPPSSQGLRVHHDTHDVFAMQTHGRKRWVTYEPAVRDPVAGQLWSGDTELGAPTLDIELRPGDCLYVPRGTLHAAATVEEASIHITIGIRNVTWHDVFRRLVDRTAADERFRGALPAGFARDPDRLDTELAERLRGLADWIAGEDARELAAEEARRFWRSRQPVYEDQLAQLLAADEVSDDTVVERRPLAICEVERHGDRIALVLGDRSVRMPAHAEPAVRLILDRGRLAVRDLADHLDKEGRQVLVRRLVGEGLLRVAG